MMHNLCVRMRIQRIYGIKIIVPELNCFQVLSAFYRYLMSLAYENTIDIVYRDISGK